MFEKFFSFLRSLVMVIIYPIFLAGISFIGVIGNLLFSSRSIDNRVIQFWARTSCLLFGVRVRVVHPENIPTGACLFVFNHASFFDVFAMCGYIPDFRFGAKVELFSIPFFGMAMRRFGALPIARKRLREVMQVYKEAYARVAKGERFALAPEGTRQENEKILGEFKSGPFIFAMETQIPIVPVIVKNAGTVFSKKSLIPNPWHWFNWIELEILPEIDLKKTTSDDKNELKNKVRDVFLASGYFKNIKT